MANISLRFYLISSYTAILSFSILCFALSLIYLQFYDMDETSQYYMLYEAEVLTESYQSGEQILEFDPGFKEYYWQLTALPQKYQDLMAEEPPEQNLLNWYQSDSHDIYIYPYQVGENKLVVVHLFALGDYGESFAYSSQLLLGLSILLVLLALSTIIWISSKAVRQIVSFQRWLEGLKNTQSNKEPLQIAQLPKEISFTELRQASETLISSRNAEQALQKKEVERVTREKAFLSTLSHELRTPIAIISAAATLLQKRGNLSDKDTKALTKLTKANTKMKQLTNTLLQLWRRQDTQQDKENIDLQSALETAINNCREHLSADITFITDYQQAKERQISIWAYTQLVDISLQNILRNACQYSADSKVLITLHPHKLTVKNTLDKHLWLTPSENETAKKRQAENEINDPEFGFGLGLYLVENICKNQGWRLKTDKNSREFCLTIDFEG